MKIFKIKRESYLECYSAWGRCTSIYLVFLGFKIKKIHHYQVVLRERYIPGVEAGVKAAVASYGWHEKYWQFEKLK